ERDAMKRPPHRIKESVFAEGMAWQIIWIGFLVGLLSLAMGYWYWSRGRAEWQTVVFTTLTLSELAVVLAIRSSKDSLFRIGLLSNRQLVVVVALTFVLQIALIYTPLFQDIFRTTPLSSLDLALTVVLSSTVFWAIELQKYFHRRRKAVV